MPRSPVYGCVALTLIWTASMDCTEGVFRTFRVLVTPTELLSGIMRLSGDVVRHAGVRPGSRVTDRATGLIGSHHRGFDTHGSGTPSERSVVAEFTTRRAHPDRRARSGVARFDSVGVDRAGHDLIGKRV